MASFFDAVALLAQTLSAKKVQYAIMGGAACYILGSPRATGDIDLVVGVTGTDVDKLDNELKATPGFTSIDEHNIGVLAPAIKISKHTVAIEIFDPSSWPGRPQYKDVGSFRIAQRLPGPKGQEVYVYTPAWLLREKISAIQERGHAGTIKFNTDLTDIQFLCGKIAAADYKKGILDFTSQPESEKHLKALLARADVGAGVKSTLNNVVKFNN